MSALFKRKHAPFRIIAALLYSEDPACILERQDEGVMVINTAALQRELRVTCDRFYEYMEYLENIKLLTILEKGYGRMVLRVCVPVGMVYE